MGFVLYENFKGEGMDKKKGLDVLFNQKNRKELTLYSVWKDTKKKTDGYVMLANELEEYLKDLKKPSLNLYMFYAIHADNNNGESFYSLEQISRILKVSVKTVSNWNKELEEVGLIKRKQQYNRSARTFLLPLSDFVFFDKRQDKTDKFILDITNEGYIYEDKYEVRNSREIFTVEKYTKSYITVRRTIYILQKKEEVTEELLWDYDEDYWYDVNDSFGLYSKNLKFDFSVKDNYKRIFKVLTAVFKDYESMADAKENIEKKIDDNLN